MIIITNRLQSKNEKKNIIFWWCYAYCGCGNFFNREEKKKTNLNTTILTRLNMRTWSSTVSMYIIFRLKSVTKNTLSIRLYYIHLQRKYDFTVLLFSQSKLRLTRVWIKRWSVRIQRNAAVYNVFLYLFYAFMHKHIDENF